MRNSAWGARPQRWRLCVAALAGCDVVVFGEGLDGDLSGRGRAGAMWSRQIGSNSLPTAPILVAQSDGSTIRCRIVIDGKVKDERTSTGVNAMRRPFVW
ncbi:MmpS family transport accessory protein [Mycobacterium marinum]|uniref:MmpS family transport accessory protein n=1 Tax=Mycobacterium marinum TaxID=1781 RepID=UPI0039C9B836